MASFSINYFCKIPVEDHTVFRNNELQPQPESAETKMACSVTAKKN